MLTPRAGCSKPAGEAGVARFVYTSTTSLYGDAMLPEAGAAVWVTEELDAAAARHLRRDQAGGGSGMPGRRARRPRLCKPCACRAAFRGRSASRRNLPSVPRRGRGGRRAGARARARDGTSADSRSTMFRRRRHSRARTAGGLFEDAASVLLERHPWAAAEFAPPRLAVATVHRPCLCCRQGDRRARLPSGARFRRAVQAAGRPDRPPRRIEDVERRLSRARRGTVGRRRATCTARSCR